MSDTSKCRNCGAPLNLSLVDLGVQAVSNSYVPLDMADAPEPKFPLHAKVCEACWLVQIDTDVPADEIFSGNYAYFSSFSTSWLEHSKRYVEDMIFEFGLKKDSLVVEIASNDGYLLQYFVERGVPVLGIEPSGSVAKVAEEKGVPTLVEFFTEELATRLSSEGKKPDLICSANVLAHVPDINDFVAGLSKLLTGDAIYTVEFPHLLQMVKDCQFDTIYHEHYSYLSLLAVEGIFAKHGMRVFHCEELPTHGGSLRVFACLDDAGHKERPSVGQVREMEADAQFDSAAGYADFAARSERIRDGLLDFLKSAKMSGKTVVAYGAAAKGNTMLNYCGVGPDLISYSVDRNPAKQGTLLPGSKIRVYDPAKLEEERPDFIVIMPWNLRKEIAKQLAHLAEKGTRFVVPVPELEIFTK
jgi:SAM-dependent methyltransferase